jgi:hypothetical protein
LLPCEAVRVAKKHRGWINSNTELRAAMDTLIDLVEGAQRAVDEEVKAEFARMLDQLEEPA